MKAFVLTEAEPGFRDVPKPEPKAGEVLVRVRAGALNRADLLIAAGHFHGPGRPGLIIGSEWAGEVAALGEGVTDFSVGQGVMGTGAGFAEFTAARASLLLPIPDAGLSFEEAACLPVALRTMHNALVTAGGLKPGQTVLIQGASSGVGLMGLKIAKLMGARLVIGSSTNAERRARLAEFGADLAVDSNDPAWVEQVLGATGGEGVDLIVDQVSGPLVNPNMRATKILGRIVNVGRLGGMHAEFDADLHAVRRITYVGVTFRTRTLPELEALDHAMKADLWPAVVVGRLSLPIDSVYPFDRLTEALARMKANQHFGKIVLSHESQGPN